MRSEAMDFGRYRGTNRRCRVAMGGGRHVAMLAMLVAGGLGLAAPARADNPGYDRPGLGFTPAALGAGELTVEQGLPTWTRDRQDGQTTSQYTADSLLRLGLGDSLELQFGGSLYNRLRETGPGTDQRHEGRGDSSVALKLVLPSARASFSWGLLGSVEFTDGAPASRNAARQYLVGLALNQQLDPANSAGMYLEDARTGGRDAYTAAINDSHALSGAWTVYAEAAWQRQPDRGRGLLAGAGLAWQPSSRVQLDAGFRHRLSGQVSDWWAGLGAAVYFGH